MNGNHSTALLNGKHGSNGKAPAGRWPVWLFIAALVLGAFVTFRLGGYYATSTSNAGLPSVTHLWHGGGQAGAEAALSTVRSLLSGQLASQQRAPLTPEGFRQLAKLRQELFCKEGSPVLNVQSPNRTVQVHDPQQTWLVKINPLPVWMNLYAMGQDFVSKDLHEGRLWEENDLKQVLWALQTPLPEGYQSTSQIGKELFLDIGANIGAFTFHVAAEGYEVISVEGMSSNQRLIRTGLCASAPELRERVTLYANGAGAERTTCYLIATDDNRGDGITLCGAHNVSHAIQMANNPAYKPRGTMDIERVDDLIQRDVKVMKMDVEGFEPFVMKGMHNLLRKHRVWFMVIEYNKVLLDGSLKDSTGQKKMEFVKDLHSLGYKISINSFHAPPLSWAEFESLSNSNAPNTMNINLFLVHPLFVFPTGVQQQPQTYAQALAQEQAQANLQAQAQAHLAAQARTKTRLDGFNAALKGGLENNPNLAAMQSKVQGMTDTIAMYDHKVSQVNIRQDPVPKIPLQGQRKLRRHMQA